MSEPYWKYAPPTDGASIPMPTFPGYMPSEAPPLMLHGLWGANDLRGASSDYLQNNMHLRTGAYGMDGIKGIGVRPEHSHVGLPGGPSIPSYQPSLIDPNLISQRRDVPLGISSGPSIPDTVHERPDSSRIANGLPITNGESNVLFVDCLPTDCTRREAGHLFRPFIGFKDIKVVHKEPRHRGDKAMVLCFVEFDEAKYALTAMEALQGYKFDDKKPNSPSLKIIFAHFPFHLPTYHTDLRSGPSHGFPR